MEDGNAGDVQAAAEHVDAMESGAAAVAREVEGQWFASSAREGGRHCIGSRGGYLRRASRGRD